MVWVTVFTAEAVWVLVSGLAAEDGLDEAEEDLRDRRIVGPEEWLL
jgi:hypothetical protein